LPQWSLNKPNCKVLLLCRNQATSEAKSVVNVLYYGKDIYELFINF
jgi:hypothetical protein